MVTLSNSPALLHPLMQNRKLAITSRVLPSWNTDKS